MKLFHYTRDDFYDNAMRDYPAVFRGFYLVVIAILFVFSKVMWRWNVENASYLEPEGDTGSVITPPWRRSCRSCRTSCARGAGFAPS